NDASFIIDYHLSLYEHQSTYSPNMPLRELIYFVNIISKRLKNKNLYGSSLVKIPVPHFVVFYNGSKPAPEHYELRLSDAFEHPTDNPEIELVCQVYNINKGNNEALLSRCPTLRDYMYFVDLVREYHAKNNFTDLKDAISQSIDQCIREDILRDFLIQHRQEVEKMMQLDYTFERQIELERQAGEEIGWKLGEEVGRKLGEEEKLRELISKKLHKEKTLEQIAEDLEETPDKILPLYEQIREELTVSQSNKTE
ncbi:MAG: PspA/IM30 family protein, partial [Lachnospiraceae bacterium]|nr:PspA/IM30 family protein [Lachnospiraceae bacterium]